MSDVAAPSPETESAPTGLFTTPYTAQQLLDVVGHVARAAAPRRPAQTSMRAFNTARAAAGHPNCPTAEAIHLRFNKLSTTPLTWTAIVEAALSDTSAERWLVTWKRSAPAFHLDRRHAHYGLRRVAQELDVLTMSPGEYDIGRDGLLARARRRGDDALPGLLPTSAQIQTIYHSWPAALAAVGLDEFQARRRVAKAPWVGTTGMPVIDAIRAFVTYNRRFPGSKELIDWMAECNAMLAAVSTKSWRSHLEEADAAMRADGETPPPLGSLGKRGRPAGGRISAAPVAYPPNKTLPGATRRGSLRRQDYWTRERCLQALTEYIQCLGPGKDGTQKHYGQMAKDRDWPAPSKLVKVGRFQNLLAEARELLSPVRTRGTPGAPTTHS